MLLASTFFMSLLYTIGPEGTAGELAAGSKCLRCRKRPHPQSTSNEATGASTESVAEVESLTPTVDEARQITPATVEGDTATPTKVGRNTLYLMLAAGVVLLAVIIRIVNTFSSSYEIQP